MCSGNLKQTPKTKLRQKTYEIADIRKAQWEAVEAYINEFTTSRPRFRAMFLSDAKEWFREFETNSSKRWSEGIEKDKRKFAD
jgi:hypothetical protein